MYSFERDGDPSEWFLRILQMRQVVHQFLVDQSYSEKPPRRDLLRSSLSTDPRSDENRVRTLPLERSALPSDHCSSEETDETTT